MENINKSIKHTRRGFAYQDKCALLVFLDLFINKEIREFYVDYPYNKIGNSLDMRAVIYLNGEIKEKIYEVKAKEKIKQGDPKEFGETLLSLYQYKKNDKNIYRYLIVEPEIKPKTISYWSNIQFINERKTRGDKTKDRNLINNVDCLSELKYKDGENIKKLNEAFKDTEEFITFIKNLKFNLGNSANINNLGYSELDELIGSKLNQIAEVICKAKKHDFLLSNSILIDVLINVVIVGASELNNNKEKSNILPLIFDKMADYFARRRIVDNNGGDDKFEEEIIKMKSKFNEYIGEIPNKAKPKLREIYEGKKIS